MLSGLCALPIFFFTRAQCDKRCRLYGVNMVLAIGVDGDKQPPVGATGSEAGARLGLGTVHAHVVAVDHHKLAGVGARQPVAVARDKGGRVGRPYRASCTGSLALQTSAPRRAACLAR
ncbi:hypothetical protein TW95_gp1800 [Pandoravirus inopinatum]|uniref:Uncharacterized protein n=1 Tax=Pandoravirus inopinatum TaxID=1605721 RepID=A0A0B5J4H9_9VIRU|nr:hypothetical protein TW95_gp1800 [Pandoravirus inopinatum]AJF98534.1 hypothetical protein [Pandoravirus inopinatum]